LSESLNELNKIFQIVEKKHKLPDGVLKQIYEIEKEVVQYALRDQIFPKIKQIIETSALSSKDWIEDENLSNDDEDSD